MKKQREGEGVKISLGVLACECLSGCIFPCLPPTWDYSFYGSAEGRNAGEVCTCVKCSLRTKQ